TGLIEAYKKMAVEVEKLSLDNGGNFNAGVEKIENMARKYKRQAAVQLGMADDEFDGLRAVFRIIDVALGSYKNAGDAKYFQNKNYFLSEIMRAHKLLIDLNSYPDSLGVSENFSLLQLPVAIDVIGDVLEEFIEEIITRSEVLSNELRRVYLRDRARSKRSVLVTSFMVIAGSILVLFLEVGKVKLIEPVLFILTLAFIPWIIWQIYSNFKSGQEKKRLFEELDLLKDKEDTFLDNGGRDDFTFSKTEAIAKLKRSKKEELKKIIEREDEIEEREILMMIFGFLIIYNLVPLIFPEKDFIIFSLAILAYLFWGIWGFRRNIITTFRKAQLEEEIAELTRELKEINKRKASLDNGGSASQASLRIKAVESLGRLPLDKNETIAIPALEAMLAVETDLAVKVTIERVLAMVRNQGVFLDDRDKPLDNGGSFLLRVQPLIIFAQTVNAYGGNKQKPLDNGDIDIGKEEVLSVLKEKAYSIYREEFDESLSGVERFKAVFLDAFYANSAEISPSLEDIAGAIKETNAFDQYRIKEGLPITFAFDNSIYIGEEHQNVFRIIYTFNKNFDAISVICAKQENEKFVIGLGGVRYYADENSENLDNLRQELFGETVYLANRTDLRGFLWGNSLDGAFVTVVPRSGTKLGRESILRLWAKSMAISGILGKYLILKPDSGTEDSDMSAIEGAVSQIARDVKNVHGKELGIYSLAATSRKLEDGKWSHSKWKVRGISITESLISAVRMLSRHSEDFPGMKPLTGKDLRVIIDGTGNVSNMVNRLLSCALYRNLIKELGMKLKIVGICGEQRGIYNANGINTFGIKGVTLSRRELLSQEAEVLVIAESKRGKLNSSYSDIKVNVVIEGIECALSRELFVELEAQGIVCIPALIASGGSAYTSFEEFFHSQVPVKVLNIKEHVLHSIECTAISLTRLVMRRWSLLKKQGLQIGLSELTEVIAGEIRAKRDEYLINPDEYVQYRAELDAIRNLSDKAAWLLSSCAVARKEILFDAENEDDLIYKLKNTTGKYGQMDAACFLGEMLSEKAVPVLEMVLSDKNRDYRVRRNAAEALGKIGSAASVETLRWAAGRDKSKKVKDMCVWALERIGVGVEKVEPRRVLEMSGEAVDRLAETIVKKWSKNAFKDMPLPTLIAITGYSAAGKTHFSKKFIAVIQNKMQEYLKKWHKEHPNKRLVSPKVLTIDFDDYIMAKSDRPTKLRSLGKMGSLKPEEWLGKWEFARFYQDVQALRRGQVIHKPVFDQITRKRKTDAKGNEDLDTIYPGYNIIIVEGIFSLSHKQTNRNYDLTVFLDGGWELRRNRDIQRYIETGKYYNMDVLEVEKQFIRKHQTEELPAIQEEMAYAEVILSTDNIPTPPYVAAFYKAVQSYRQWQVNKSNLSFSDKETQLRRLYQHPDFNGIRGSPIEVKVV
ncbi:MAG: HEAT repeat domain-containing protein, partial [Candidatus Omnitrophica bacterium]|nr:HEAT repeat domain-containing protein [Candidatus Omnitrophota bacterium]